ncbi:MAG: hypothetical protein AAGJ40_01660 [Planctomycetota bacterium]
MLANGFLSTSTVSVSFVRIRISLIIGGLATLLLDTGCSNPSLVSRLPGGLSPTGAPQDPNAVTVTPQTDQITSDLQPVPQRLSKTYAKPSSGEVGGTDPSHESAHSSPDAMSSTAGYRPAGPTSPSATSQSGTQQSRLAESQTSEGSADVSKPENPLAGVKTDELMAALESAPPEIRRLAVAQMLAMSRKQAQSSERPASIDRAITDALDSLPELPDEVPEMGLTPTRLASREANARMSDVDREKVTRSPNDPSAAITTVAHQEDATEDHPTKVNDSVIAPEALVAQMPAANTTNLSNQELFDALVERLNHPVTGESEADQTRRQVMARHLMVMAGDPDGATEAFDGLDPSQQEYLRHQLLGLWTLIDPNGHPVPSRRMSSALPSIREAIQHLAAASDSLEVRALEFCTEIEAYGQIKPFQERRFTSGQEVILYCEIENFVTVDDDNGYETMLQGSYEILDGSGTKVISQSLPVDRQVSRNRLRDYFIAYQMHLPNGLTPGSYRLRLTMEDVHGRKFGRSDVQFDIITR